MSDSAVGILVVVVGRSVDVRFRGAIVGPILSFTMLLLFSSDVIEGVIVGDSMGSIAVDIHGTEVGVVVGDGVGSIADVIHGTEVGVVVGDGVGSVADVIHGTEVGVVVGDGEGGIADVIHFAGFGVVVVVGVILVIVVEWLSSGLMLELLSGGLSVPAPRK